MRKNTFRVMIAAITASAALTAAVPAMAAAGQTTQITAGETAAAGGAVDKKEALAIALADAGLEKSDVRRARTHRDYDDGRKFFEVSFRAGDTEYNYDIDAATGTIVDYDVDINEYGWDDNGLDGLFEFFD